MHKIDTLIFDLDGTIIDSQEDISTAVNVFLKDLGLPELSREKILSFVGHGSFYLVEKVLAETGGPVEEAEKLYPRYLDFYRAYGTKSTKMYPGVQEILDRFSDRNLAVATNKPLVITTPAIEKLRLDRYFPVILTPELVENRKPHPEMIQKILKHFGRTPKSAMMIGDSDVDIKTGHNAGCLTCGVTYGIGETESLLAEQPDFVIDSISKLKDIID